MVMERLANVVSNVQAAQPASGMSSPWINATYSAVAQSEPQWLTLGWPSEQEWIQAGSPAESYAAWQVNQAKAMASNALAQVSSMLTGSNGLTAGAAAAPAVDVPPPSLAPAAPVQPPETPFTAGLDPNLYQQAQQAINAAPQPTLTAGAQAQVTPEAMAQRAAQTQLAGLGGPLQGISDFGASIPGMVGNAALDAAGAVGDVVGPVASMVPNLPVTTPFGAMAPALNAGVSQTLTQQGLLPTLGEGTEFAMDEQGNPVSRFMANEVRPVVGDISANVANAFARATPVGAGANLALGAVGTDVGEVARFAGETLTPASPADIALSVFIPATADWMDAKRILQSSGVLDDAGRLLSGVSKQGVDNLLRQAGKSYDELVNTISRNIGPPGGGMYSGVPLPDDSLRRQIDEAAGLADEASRVTAEGVTTPGSAAGDLVTPSPAAPAATMPPPPAGTTPPTRGAPQDPVQKLTDLIDQARPLPEQTEALRSAERSQRIAQSSRILEEGGFTQEAFEQAKGPLSGEYSRAAFDPPNVNFQPEEIQQLRRMIGEADLRTFERINANDALNAVLEGRLNEVRPFEITLLDRVYGSKFSLAVAQKAAPPSFADKVYEWWLASILSGPMTQARNIVGNTAAALTAPVERAFSAAIDPVVARATGRATERFWQEVPEQVIGMAQGLPEGVHGALRILGGALGESALTEAARGPAIDGLKGRIIRLPLTALEAMDSFFGSVNFEGAYRALAVRTARQEGLTGKALELRIADLLANRPEELIEQATQARLYRLFRDEPTRYGQAIMSAREKAPGLRFLVPFARTPDRLLAYGIRHSPLGLLDFPMWNRLVKGNPEAVDELSRTLIGSSVVLGLGAMVANGQLDITGAVPSDRAARDRFFRAGKQAFSVNLPGLGWVQYSQIPGIDTALTTLAAAKESFEKGEGFDHLIGEMGASIAENIFDRSYVTGLADFIAIFSGAGYEEPEDKALRWVSRQISGGVPYSAFGRQMSQFFDQNVYQPNGIAENLATGIGLGGPAGVPQRLTAFGDVAERPFPSPVSISPDRQNAVDAELERMGKEVTFVGTSIGGRKLSREEQREYQQLAGQKTYEALVMLFEMPVYQGLSDPLKEKAIDRAITKARDEAKDILSLRFAGQALQGATP